MRLLQNCEKCRAISEIVNYVHPLNGVQHIHINLTLIHYTSYRHADADQNQFSQGLVFHMTIRHR